MIRRVLTGLLMLGSPVLAAEWTILPEQSTLRFETAITYPIGDPPRPVTGGLPIRDGRVLYDPSLLDKAELDITLDVAAISVGDLGLDRELRGGTWLGVRRFAVARLQAKGFEQIGAGQYQTQATLILRGTPQVLPVVFGVTFENGQAIATGTAKVDRYAFRVGASVPETVTPRFVPIWFTVVADEVSP
ncbi:MAG: YceI family protein [Rhodobacteraceae bacterium]|nr:YceI family protein [Paracoccaceae bacterium]